MFRELLKYENFCMDANAGAGAGAGAGAPAATPPNPTTPPAAAPAPAQQTPPSAAADLQATASPPAQSATPPAAQAPTGLAFLPNATAEDIAFAQSKGWDQSVNPAADIFRSYQNLQRLFGADKADNAIVIPGEGAAQAEWDAIYNRLGRPATAEEYSPEHFSGMDEETSKALKAAGHQLGLTEKQIAGIREWNNATSQKIQADLEQQALVEVEQQKTALKTEWGAAYDQNMQFAKEAVAKLGWNADQINALQQALGFDGVMKMAANLGQSVGEGKFIVSDGAGRATGMEPTMTPEQAKQALMKLNTDTEFQKAWMDKMHPRHNEMVQRKAQLTGWAYPSK